MKVPVEHFYAISSLLLTMAALFTAMLVTVKYPFIWIKEKLHKYTAAQEVKRSLKENTTFNQHYPHFLKRHAIEALIIICIFLSILLTIYNESIISSVIKNEDLRIALLTGQITMVSLLLPIVISVVTSSLRKTRISSIIRYYYTSIKVHFYITSIALSTLLFTYLQILVNTTNQPYDFLYIASVIWFIFNLIFSLYIISISLKLLSPKGLNEFIKKHSTTEVFTKVVDAVHDREK